MLLSFRQTLPCPEIAVNKRLQNCHQKYTLNLLLLKFCYNLGCIRIIVSSVLFLFVLWLGLNFISAVSFSSSQQHLSENPELPPSVRKLKSHWLVELKEYQTLSPVKERLSYNY